MVRQCAGGKREIVNDEPGVLCVQSLRTIPRADLHSTPFGVCAAQGSKPDKLWTGELRVVET